MPDAELIKAFDALWAASEKRSWIFGRIGKLEPDGTISIQTGRPGYLYVRVGAEGATATSIAKNVNAPIKAHLPIKMRLESGELVIHGVDYNGLLEAFGDGEDPGYYVGKHTHALGSGLEYAIEGMRFHPGRVQWSTGLEVTIFSFRYYWGGTWKTWADAEVDITSELPAAGKWCWVLVGVDPETNTAVAVKGIDYNGQAELLPELIDDIAFDSYIPCAAVQITDTDTEVNDISRWYDAHGWIGHRPHDLGDHSTIELAPAVEEDEFLAWDSTAQAYINQTHDEADVPRIIHRIYQGTRVDITLASDIGTLPGGTAGGYFNIRGQGGSPDDLVTLNGGLAGQIVVLTGVNETITVKDGTGNIQLGADRTLSTAKQNVVLFYNGAEWLELIYTNL